MDIDGTVSVMPVFLFLPRWADRRHRKWDVGVGGITVVWLSSLINDWFVLVRLFHSSSKLDSMQILEWMLLSLKHNNDAQWCMFASYIWIEQEPERDGDVDGGWEGRIKVWLKEEKQKQARCGNIHDTLIGPHAPVRNPPFALSPSCRAPVGIQFMR